MATRKNPGSYIEAYVDVNCPQCRSTAQLWGGGYFGERVKLEGQCGSRHLLFRWVTIDPD
jgi:hypothetical protein